MNIALLNCLRLSAFFTGTVMTVSDDAVLVAILKRPAPTQYVMPINIDIDLFIRFCDYLLILRSA